MNYSFYGEATFGDDYTAPGDVIDSITIPAGQSSVTITVTPVNDAVDDDAESVILGLRAGEGYRRGMPSSASVGIIDNDGGPLPKIRIDSNRVSIAESATNIGVTYTITREGPTTQAVNVTYWLGGTATEGVDYTGPTSHSVTIPMGQSSASVTYYPINDTVDDNNECIFVGLWAVPGYTLDAWNQVTTRIIDNDGTPESSLPYVGIAVDKTKIYEATPGSPATFTIRRDDTNAALYINYHVSGIGAVNGATSYATYGDDFTTSPTLANTSGPNAIQTIFMPIGVSSVTVTVSAINDILPEGKEIVVVSLVEGAGYRLAGAMSNSEAVEIVDDDGPPTVTIVTDDSQASEVLASDTLLQDRGQFEVVLSKAMPTSTTVSITTAGSSASPSDYTLTVTTYGPNGGTVSVSPDASGVFPVTIPAGETRAYVILVATYDNLPEGDEKAKFKLVASPSYVIGSPSSTTIAIEDGQGKVTVRLAGASSMPEDLGWDDWDGAGREFDFVVEVWGSPNSSQTFSLAWEGTATVGNDYDAGPGSVTVVTGSSGAGSTHVYAHVRPDLIYEGDGPNGIYETIILKIAGSTDARAKAEARIENDDGRNVSVRIDDALSKTTNEVNAEVFEITATRSLATLQQDITVDVDPTSTATHGLDYRIYYWRQTGNGLERTRISGRNLQFRFAPGQSMSKNRTGDSSSNERYELEIINDSEIDGGQQLDPGQNPGDLPDEFIKFHVVKDDNMKIASSATVTIQDDDKYSIVDNRLLEYWPPPEATIYHDADGPSNWVRVQENGQTIYWQRLITRHEWVPLAGVITTGYTSVTEGQELGTFTVEFSQSYTAGIDVGVEIQKIVTVGGSVSYTGSATNTLSSQFVAGIAMPPVTGYRVGYLPLASKQHHFLQRIYGAEQPPEDEDADGHIDWEEEKVDYFYQQFNWMSLWYNHTVGAALFYVPVQQ